VSSIENLWKFQEADMALIKYQSGVKNSPVRKKLMQARNVLVNGQETMRKIEKAADDNKTRVADLGKSQDECSERLKKLMGEAEKQDFEDLQAVQSAIQEAESLQNEMTAIRKEYSAIIAKGDTDSKLLVELKKKLGKAKDEYVELKTSFEQETAQAEAEIKRLKEQSDALSKSVDKALLRRYVTVRKNCVPAVALIENAQCTGCNMSLPSLVMHNIKDSAEIFECENCGRILYMS
jgi:predicted  nucleic acid-binding Zn-ribbon protein